MPEEKRDRPRSLRPFWSGTISFGLVSVPVNLWPANRSSGISLRMLAPDGTPLRRTYYCPAENKPVHPEHIIRGYPLDGDEYVLVTEQELESLEPRKTRDIDLRRFVKRDSIDPIYFERAYYLTPSGDSNKAYRLLAEVMEKSGQAGIATFVMRAKEYLVAILAEKGILRAETLRYQDEIRTPEEVGLPQRSEPPKKRVSELKKAIEKHTRKRFDPEDLEDAYAARLRKLVEKKRKQHEDLVESAPEEEPEHVDLMEIIKRDLRSGGGNGAPGNGRKRKGKPDDLQDASKDELYERAQDLDIPGRSKMSKSELIRALRQRKRS